MVTALIPGLDEDAALAVTLNLLAVCREKAGHAVIKRSGE